MPYRFVHSADIHLDSPLKSLALRDPELAELIGNATRRAFVNIVELCLKEQVDALLLAGDLYDGVQRSTKTARFLFEQLSRLNAAGIAVFVVRGNHDAESTIPKELTFPLSVTVFAGRAEAVAVANANTPFPVVVHGLSFAHPHAPDSLLDKFRPPVADAFNIGLLHTSLGGSPGHDAYAPCGVADLQASGFEYWALGHIHKRSVVPGRCTIVMPGNPQGRDINESGPKTATLVTIGDDRSVDLKEHVTGVAQFERVTVSAEGIGDWRVLVDRMANAIQQAHAAAISPHLVARPRLTGTTPLAWRIRRDRDLLREEAAVRAPFTAWIEGLEIDVRAPGADIGDDSDPILELKRSIDEDIVRSSAYRAEAAEIARDLLPQLPREMRQSAGDLSPASRDLLGSDEAAFDAAVARLAQDGAEDVLARMHGATGEDG